MAVKLLMTWDILPGREQEYFEFVVRDWIPGSNALDWNPATPGIQCMVNSLRSWQQHKLPT